MPRWRRALPVPESSKRWRVLKSGASAVHALALMYLRHCQVRQVSGTTVEAWAHDLAYFAEWCEERDVVRPGEISKSMLERFQRHLFYFRKPNGAPLSIRRQLNLLGAVQTWFRWLTKNNHIAANPAADLDLPRKPGRQLRQPLTTEEVERVLSSLDLSDPMQLRDRAMFEVLYSTGLRRSEVLNLMLHDVDANNGTVFVRQGKGRRDRFVPIGERALLWLARYVEEVREQWCLDPAERAVFLQPDGTVPSPDMISDRVRKRFAKLGIEKRGACHLFRHTMATEMLDHGADLRYVQEMLGHARLDTTQIYTHVSVAKLKAVHAATHPGAKLRATAATGDAQRSLTDTSGMEPGAA